MTISCNRAAIVPKECHSIGAKSGSTSRFLLNSMRACSRVSGELSSCIHEYTCSRFSDEAAVDAEVRVLVFVAVAVVLRLLAKLELATPVVREELFVLLI